MIRDLWLIAQDQFRYLFRDRAALLVLVGGTLFYGLFYPLPYRDQVLRDVPIVVIDQDGSVLSRELIRALQATEQLKVVAVFGDKVIGEEWLRDGRVGGVVMVPVDFERKLLRAELVKVGVWGNGAYALLYSQVVIGVSGVVEKLSTNVAFSRLVMAGRTVEEIRGLAEPINLQLHELFNPAGGYGTYVVPAVLVIILQQTLLIAIGMMENRTMVIVARPISRLLGRLLPYIIIHMVLGVVLVEVVYKIYEFPSRTSILGTLCVLLPFLISTAFLGFLLAALFKTRETALQILMLISMPALFLAGLTWPVEAMPMPLVVLGWLLPSTAGIDVFVRLHQMGASFIEVVHSWVCLWGLVVLYGLAALCLERRSR